MLTESRKEQLKNLGDYLFKKMFPNEDENEREKLSDWKELLRDIEYLLNIAPKSYRPVSKEDKQKNYYLAKCDQCGWFGSSSLLMGGGAMYDSGDYFDCYCPVCGNSEF